MTNDTEQAALRAKAIDSCRDVLRIAKDNLTEIIGWLDEHENDTTPMFVLAHESRLGRVTTAMAKAWANGQHNLSAQTPSRAHIAADAASLAPYKRAFERKLDVQRALTVIEARMFFRRMVVDQVRLLLDMERIVGDEKREDF